MQNASTTALVSAFARAYHHRHHRTTIYDDTLAHRLLTREEWNGIARHMAQGISFFHPGFSGDEAAALRWVVDQQLSPTPLGRAAFADEALEQAGRQGGLQYVNIAAGYDTFAYRQPDWARKVQIWELDHPATGEDKLARLRTAGIAVPDNVRLLPADVTKTNWVRVLRDDAAFCQDRPSFFSLLGLCYYLTDETLRLTLRALADLSPRGGLLAFDYPDELALTDRAGMRAQRQAALAAAADEPMLAGHSRGQMERLLEDCGFRVREHLTPPQITERLFLAHNTADPDHAMTAFDNVNYCLAVRI